MRVLPTAAAMRAPNSTWSPVRAEAHRVAQFLATEGGSHACAPRVAAALRAITRESWQPEAQKVLRRVRPEQLFPQHKAIGAGMDDLGKLLAPQCAQHGATIAYLRGQYDGAVQTALELLRVLKIALEHNAILRQAADDRLLSTFHESLGEALGEMLQPEKRDIDHPCPPHARNAQAPAPADCRRTASGRALPLCEEEEGEEQAAGVAADRQQQQEEAEETGEETDEEADGDE